MMNQPGGVYDLTQSICPECRQLVDAEVLLRDNRVLMRKRCPEHGEFEALLFGDAALYTRLAPFNKPGRPALQFATHQGKGCPYDCGLCPEHEQHSCLALIEVTNACNLDCPLCFAGAGTRFAHSGFQLSIEQVNFMLDRFMASEGTPEVVQFSGGEPTLHPRILDFIELAQSKGISYVMLNTNGLRIAHDDRFLAGLQRLKPHVYLQFDGFNPETNRILRGRSDLLDIKLRALDRLAEADVRVVLVAAVERGVNEHEVGAIVEFGLRHPAVFGINFQPAFRAQRHIPADPLTRITTPDILSGIQAQTNGLLNLDDFVPVPCCNPACSFVTYALLEGDNIIPLPRVLAIEQSLKYVGNRTMPGLSDDLVKVLERLWSASAQVGGEGVAADVENLLSARSPDAALAWDALPLLGFLAGSEDHAAPTRAGARCSSCHSHLPLSSHTPRDLARHVFMVSTRDFMDPWTFNVKTIHKCCIANLTPDGRSIPMCAYNSLGYREQITQSLMQGNGHAA